MGCNFHKKVDIYLRYNTRTTMSLLARSDAFHNNSVDVYNLIILENIFSAGLDDSCNEQLNIFG